MGELRRLAVEVANFRCTLYDAVWTKEYGSDIHVRALKRHSHPHFSSNVGHLGRGRNP